jgi:hypothetical protein
MAALQGMYKLLTPLRREKEERELSPLSLGCSGADKALSLGTVAKIYGASRSPACCREETYRRRSIKTP